MRLRCLLKSSLFRTDENDIEAHDIMLPRCPLKGSLVRTGANSIHGLWVASMSSFIMVLMFLLQSTLFRINENNIQAHDIILLRCYLKGTLAITDSNSIHELWVSSMSSFIMIKMYLFKVNLSEPMRTKCKHVTSCFQGFFYNFPLPKPTQSSTWYRKHELLWLDSTLCLIEWISTASMETGKLLDWYREHWISQQNMTTVST